VRTLAAIPPLAVALLLPACASYPLHATLSDAELRSRLDANFQPGTPLAEVESRLDELRASKKYRRLYPGEPGAGSQRRLLARLYRPGGPWIEEATQTIDWVDVNFNLDDHDTLTTFTTDRGGLRYVNGRPYAPLPYETLYPLNNWPSPPPPPAY